MYIIVLWLYVFKKRFVRMWKHLDILFADLCSFIHIFSFKGLKLRKLKPNNAITKLKKLCVKILKDLQFLSVDMCLKSYEHFNTNSL